jgi:hypothetical protein
MKLLQKSDSTDKADDVRIQYKNTLFRWSVGVD